jgi:molybdopterin-guanine dinucleotide biosynthesis protein A
MVFDAIVPAGGRARRLAGADKALLTIRGERLLDVVLAAVRGARATVVVGPPELPVPAGVALVREDPPFGGPVAAVAAGLTALPARPAGWVLVLAVDQPGAAALVDTLLAALGSLADDDEVDVLVGVDPSGHRQWLTALYRPGPLSGALARIDPSGASMRALAADLTILEVPLPVAACGDIDTPADAAGWQLSRRSGREER